jgi:hypothetical protein
MRALIQISSHAKSAAGQLFGNQLVDTKTIIHVQRKSTGMIRGDRHPCAIEPTCGHWVDVQRRSASSPIYLMLRFA